MKMKIECNECGYEGTTTTTKSFPSLGNYHTIKYVCPKCGSRDIEYKPREGMEWMSGMVRKWENTKSEEK